MKTVVREALAQSGGKGIVTESPVAGGKVSSVSFRYSDRDWRL
jgi:hypothetical protein